MLLLLIPDRRAVKSQPGQNRRRCRWQTSERTLWGKSRHTFFDSALTLLRHVRLPKTKVPRKLMMRAFQQHNGVPPLLPIASGENHTKMGYFALDICGVFRECPTPTRTMLTKLSNMYGSIVHTPVEVHATAQAVQPCLSLKIIIKFLQKFGKIAFSKYLVVGQGMFLFAD